MCVSVFLYVHVHSCARICGCMCVCDCMCVYMHARACVSVCACMHVHSCARAYVDTCVCDCMCVHICLVPHLPWRSGRLPRGGHISAETKHSKVARCRQEGKSVKGTACGDIQSLEGAGAAPWGALCGSPSLHGTLRQPLSIFPLYGSENCVLGPRKEAYPVCFWGSPSLLCLPPCTVAPRGPAWIWGL